MTPDKGIDQAKKKNPAFPAPGKEPRELFIAALDIVSDLFKSNDLTLELGVNGQVDIVIESNKITSIPKDKFQHGLTFEHFETLLRTEFDSLVHAATYLDPIEGINISIPSEVLKEVGQEEFLWRLHETATRLISNEIKEQAIFRRSTNGFVIKDINWQISVKKHDKQKGKVPDIAYACVSLIYDSARNAGQSLRLGSKGVFVELPVLREPKQLSLELHQADVDQIIKSLTDLRNNLEKFKKANER